MEKVRARQSSRRAVWKDPQRCASARSKREPDLSQDQHSGWMAIQDDRQVCRDADPSLERTGSRALNLSLESQDWSSGALGNLKQESRQSDLCFEKGPTKMVLILGEGKKSEGRGPFQRVLCPWGERKTGHQSFQRERTSELG